jgi:hypothetical protein
MVSWILLTISLLADLISLIGAIRTQPRAPKLRRLGLPLALVLLTALATYQASLIQQFTAAKNEAAKLVRSWPDTVYLSEMPDGTKIGIILEGLHFLEHHRKEFPETYEAARVLIKNRIKDFTPSDNEYADSRLLTDVATAMAQLVKSNSR